MRIGIMLRAIDEQGGIGVYTRNLVPELLRIDSENQYILFYQNREHLGRFGAVANVSERYVPGKHKAYWDQIAIPRACRREKIDLLFHPKFTLPLLAPCKTVMTVHGADWFIPEQARYYRPWDVRYIRAVMPLYIHKASAVISVSQETTDNFERILKLPPGKIHTIYFAPARNFQPVGDPAVLQQVRERYQLPEQFILTLTKRQGDARKNLGAVLQAYARYHASTLGPHKLVIGGKDCHLFRDDYGLPAEGYGRDILFPGWIEQSDLPAVMSLASVYLYPSNLEAFPIPLTEAMACGTPVVTSNVNGLQEIAGDAALLVDPGDPAAIATALAAILDDVELAARLSRQGLERAKNFTWDRCAAATLALFEKTVHG